VTVSAMCAAGVSYLAQILDLVAVVFNKVPHITVTLRGIAASASVDLHERQCALLGYTIILCAMLHLSIRIIMQGVSILPQIVTQSSYWVTSA
jgi:hypothetical protein